jgi:transcriptional regulator with XRE-family HTH domain
LIDQELRQVGKRIRYQRNRRGWTHEQLGTKANIHHVRLRRMEYGHHLSPLTIRKLAQALNINPDELFPGRSRKQFIWQFHKKHHPIHWGKNGWDNPLKPETSKVHQS